MMDARIESIRIVYRADDHIPKTVSICAAAIVFIPTDDSDIKRIQTFESGGLWGIESDSESYLKEVARDEIADLKDYLGKFGISLDSFDKLAKQAKWISR